MNNLAQVLPVRTAVAPARPVAAYGPQDEQFRQLVDAAVHGNAVATQRVLESIRPIVLRYCRARIGRLDRSFASADDVVQEVCLSVISALPSYRDQGQPFLVFVYGIAQQKVAAVHRALAAENATVAGEVQSWACGDGDPSAIDALLSASSLGTPAARRMRQSNDDHALDSAAAEIADRVRVALGLPDRRQVQDELKSSMDRLLAVLSDKQREIVVLRVVVGLSAEETADLVGSTPGAVRVAQHRALTKLRKLIGSAKEF
jgi:RNA polymerase sigma-70 factor, ECF subfamily